MSKRSFFSNDFIVFAGRFFYLGKITVLPVLIAGM